MECGTSTPLRIGAWRLDPMSGEMSRDGETVRLEVRTLRLLVYLVERTGEVVSLDDLLKHVWPDVIVTQASVYQAVTSLRRVLGDDAKQPTYVATVPRLGYRMIATVSPWTAPAPAPDPSAASGPATSASTSTNVPTESPRLGVGWMWAVGALCAAVGAGFLLSRTAGLQNRAASGAGASALQKSVAVLPFVDLTEKMSEEEFADGLTEEVIDRLNRIPGLRVPPPTSSFYFKNKKRSVGEIAGALKVDFVIDGSTRKSGSTLRVAVRLIRADNGVVVWSATFDRPWGDMLTVQDDIAGQVTKALVASIDDRPTLGLRGVGEPFD